jgi:hypothetical protein
MKLKWQRIESTDGFYAFVAPIVLRRHPDARLVVARVFYEQENRSAWALIVDDRKTYPPKITAEFKTARAAKVAGQRLVEHPQ